MMSKVRIVKEALVQRFSEQKILFKNLMKKSMMESYFTKYVDLEFAKVFYTIMFYYKFCEILLESQRRI